MYNFYPSTETYVGQDDSRLTARASQAELDKWEMSDPFDEITDEMDAANMAKADRFVSELPTIVRSSRGIMHLSGVRVEV